MGITALSLSLSVHLLGRLRVRVRATLVLDFGRIIARKTDPGLRAMIWRANEMQYVHVTRICETLYLGMEFWNWAR